MPLIDDQTFNTCITSPPYWGLRDYGIEPSEWPEITFQPQIGLPEITIAADKVCLGLESDPWAYIGHLVHVFRQVKRTLKDDGTFWLNIGDSYANYFQNRSGTKVSDRKGGYDGKHRSIEGTGKIVGGLKRKDMVGIPFMLAFALRSDGWYLRQDIVWHKKQTNA